MCTRILLLLLLLEEKKCEQDRRSFEGRVGGRKNNFIEMQKMRARDGKKKYILIVSFLFFLLSLVVHMSLHTDSDSLDELDNCQAHTDKVTEGRVQRVASFLYLCHATCECRIPQPVK